MSREQSGPDSGLARAGSALVSVREEELYRTLEWVVHEA